MPTCELSPPDPNCEREVLEDDDYCILHSEDSEKDEEAFKEALEEHREGHGPDFRKMVFPTEIRFSNDFEEHARFTFAVFMDEAHFSGVNFEEGATFPMATFKGEAQFVDANFKSSVADFAPTVFMGDTSFKDATFEKGGIFRGSRFDSKADFRKCTLRGGFFSNVNFTGVARFHGATFDGPADFSRATFTRVFFMESLFQGWSMFTGTFQKSQDVPFLEARFTGCEFRDDGLIAGVGEEELAFDGDDICFNEVTMAPDVSLRFRYADLSRCRFLRTDLRDVEFTGVNWCEDVSSDGWWFDELFQRVGIYDEVCEQNQEGTSDSDKEEESDLESAPPWSEIERLYRQLKRNHENRGDFPRGGDFHIGEKVARRKRAWRNLSSDWGQWILLGLYRALSKYGERALPATLWLVGLVFICAAGYLSMGGVTDSVWLTSWSLQNWWEALVLSGEATLFPVRSAGFHRVGPRTLNLFQRAVSPVLIALLALALRQRVKR